MTALNDLAWKPLRFSGHGMQPQTHRSYDCDPAWDVTAIYPQPDQWLHHPDFHRAAAHANDAQPHDPLPNVDKKTGLFWDKHIDRRFAIRYPRAEKNSPRNISRTIGDAEREWDVLIAQRDQYLAAAGLTASSSPLKVARVLADSFLFDNFNLKPLCTTYATDQRALNNPIDGLLHKCHCVGCANAFAAMANSCGIPVRTIGCGSHIIAEALLDDGRWHQIENSGRRDPQLACFFQSSFHDMYLHPMDDHGNFAPESYKDSLFKRPNPQFHFPLDTWGNAPTLRWSTCCAHALYPQNQHWGFKAENENRLPMIRRAGGFYWPVAHISDDIASVRKKASDIFDPIPAQTVKRDFFYHRFEQGQSLRQSFFIGDLAGMTGLEIVFTFAPSRRTDFSIATGDKIFVSMGSWKKSLLELSAWPPREAFTNALPADASTGENLHATVRVPLELLQSQSVHWIELAQNAATEIWAPCVPAAMEPYIPPLLAPNAVANTPAIAGATRQ